MTATTHGDALKQHGCATALQHACAEWRQRFDTEALWLLRANGTVTSDEVVQRCGMPPGHPSATGAAMRSFAMRNGLRCDGYRKSTMPSCHSAVVAVWVNANTPKDSTGGCCPPPPCSALAGTFDIEAMEQAFFNHDHDGTEPAPGQWEKRRDQWRSFKAYLAAHPRQEISGCDAYKEEMPNAEVSHGSAEKKL